MVELRKKPRILMLCGHSQNAQIFGGKTMAIVKELSDSYEFVYLDPPLTLSPLTISDEPQDSFHLKNKQNRTWWYRSGLNRTDFKQFDTSMIFLRDFLQQNEPFQGVWGFSQGAAMAALLTAVLEAPTTHSAFTTAHSIPPFKFCIISSGTTPADPKLSRLLSHRPIATPSLHTIGLNDAISIPESSETLAMHFQDPRIEYSDGAHHVPSKAIWRSFYKKYIDGILGLDDEIAESPMSSTRE